MPSLAKLETRGGKLTSSANSPRPLGPSVRAVMTLVPIPISMTAICAAKMPSESRADRGGRPQNRAAGEAAPGAGAGGPDGAAARLEPGQVDRHVGHAEAVRRRAERPGRTQRAVVEQVLLQIAPEHEGALDVVRMRDLFQHEHESV